MKLSYGFSGLRCKKWMFWTVPQKMPFEIALCHEDGDDEDDKDEDEDDDDDDDVCPWLVYLIKVGLWFVNIRKLAQNAMVQR